MNTQKREWDFEKLVGTIRQVHEEMAAQAGRAVNVSLTMRNWLIGFYIAEYEQNGADRAEYGTRLLENLSTRLSDGGMEGMASRSLRQYRQFYSIYPEIWQTPSAKTLDRLIPASIRQTLPAKSQSESPQYTKPAVPALELIQKLSFSHENIGQLNTYVSWYKKNMMSEGDNPPIGILLCTQRDRTLVEYALAGMDNGLFVSKYQLELPKKEEMQRFIEEQVRETES